MLVGLLHAGDDRTNLPAISQPSRGEIPRTGVIPECSRLSKIFWCCVVLVECLAETTNHSTFVFTQVSSNPNPPFLETSDGSQPRRKPLPSTQTVLSDTAPHSDRCPSFMLFRARAGIGLRCFTSTKLPPSEPPPSRRPPPRSPPFKAFRSNLILPQLPSCETHLPRYTSPQLHL